MDTSQNARKAFFVWLGVAGLIALILVPLAWPIWKAWQCLRAHDAVGLVAAHVVEKVDEAGVRMLVLQLEEGPAAGRACTAKTSDALFEAAASGDAVEVAYLEESGGTCILSSTIGASAELLFMLNGALFFLVCGLVWAGVFVQRTLTRPVWPARLLDRPEGEDVRCPACGKLMDEGYAPIMGGIHWRRLGEPIGLPTNLQGLPGTVGWRGRPRLHAFRCVPCEILTLQYGKPDGAS